MEKKTVNFMAERHDGFVVIDVTYSNINGDPDAMNAPRTNPYNGNGLLTAVCTKRHLRSAIQARHAGDPRYCNMHIDTTSVFGEKRNMQVDTEAGEKSSLDYQLDRYYDFRLLGTPFAPNYGKCQGPLQVRIGESVDPVDIVPMPMTRQALSKDTDILDEGKETMLGKKSVVRYGLYVVPFQFLPCLAKKTKFTQDDFEAAMDGFVHLFDHSRSAIRSNVNVRHVFDFTHTGSQYGDISFDDVQRAVKITHKDGVDVPSSFSDYRIEVDMASLPATVKLKDWANP